MAKNNRNLLTTCPVCGYTDTAGDAEVLHSAIEEHIRMSHNLDPASLSASTVVKENKPVEESNDPDVGAGTAAAFGVGVLGHNSRINQ